MCLLNSAPTALSTVLLSCAALSVAAYRESFAKIQQDVAAKLSTAQPSREVESFQELELELQEELQLRDELMEAFDAFEALEGHWETGLAQRWAPRHGFRLLLAEAMAPFSGTCGKAPGFGVSI